jgi:hypothetical protein
LAAELLDPAAAAGNAATDWIHRRVLDEVTAAEKLSQEDQRQRLAALGGQLEQISSAESVDAILQGMTWLGLEYDEGPFFQTHRFPRYQELIDQMLRVGTAYHCYCTKDRLEQLRNEQMARKEKCGALLGGSLQRSVRRK